MLGLSTVVPRDPFHQLTIALCIVGLFLAAVFVLARKPKAKAQPPSTVEAYLKFAYGCFLKPHTGDGSGSQQDALVRLYLWNTTYSVANTTQESFYKTQADVYDATRLNLLRGREDMLGLVAAQLKHRTETGLISQRPVWVDVSSHRASGVTLG